MVVTTRRGRPWQSRVQLRVAGWWFDGGSAVITVDGKKREPIKLKLSRREWATLAILVGAAISAGQLQWENYQVPAQDVADQLKLWHIGDGKAETVHAIVLKLRQKFNKTGLAARFSLAEPWGNALIQTGYSLDLPPKQLQLDLTNPALLMAFDGPK